MATQSTGRTGGHSKRGFAAMSKDKQREIAKKGGEHSHSGGRAASVRAKNKEE